MPKKKPVTPQNELLSHLFQSNAWSLAKCLAPGMDCTAPAIRAHSVQNAGALDLLVREGHVKAPMQRMDRKSGPSISFESVGRNEATTFQGFCASHDAEIFRPIDTAPIDPMNPQHLFLMAYRAVSRELLATMEGSSKQEGGYRKRKELGLDSGSEPTPAGWAAMSFHILAGDTFLYKERFDEMYLLGDYSSISHDVLRLSQGPTIAVSSLISSNEVRTSDGDLARICVNVLPISSDTSLAVFSYTHDHATVARASLATILASEGVSQKYFLSKFLLNLCENFVVSPEHFDTWKPEKVEIITHFLRRTVNKPDVHFEDQALYLF
jgi:hypothetical protein